MRFSLPLVLRVLPHLGSVLCLSLSAIANDDANLVSNPGFEAGKVAWGLFVPGAHAGMYSEFIISSNDPHGGVACAEMRADRPIRYALTAFGGKKHAVSPKDRYRMRAWVRFSDESELHNGEPGAYLRATLEKEHGVDIEDPLGHIFIGLKSEVARRPTVGKLAIKELPKGWQKIEAVVEIPDGVSLMGLALFVQGVSGPVYWDDVLLERVGIAVPLSPTLSSK